MSWSSRHINPNTKAAMELLHSKNEDVRQLLADWVGVVRKYNDLSGAYITLEQEVIRLRHENEFMIRFIERQLNKEAEDGVLHSDGTRMSRLPAQD